MLENINICQKGETSFPNDLSSLVNLSGNCKDELIVTQLVLEKSETALNMQQLLN